MTAGVVAVTKADLADPAHAARRRPSCCPAQRSCLSRRPPAKASRSSARRWTARPRGSPGRAPGGALRLHVDRSFTIRGAGTVVTGTLWEGTAARGDEVRILPAGTAARIRSVQVHDEPRERAEAGQRVALNLAGVRRDEVARGDVVVAAAGGARGAARLTVRPTFRLDVALSWATPDARPDGGTRVAVHHGTRESPARLAELGGRYFQLRLEQPLVPARGDRLVIRSLAPPDTLGGGVVLDPDPPRHGPSRDLLARLARLERGEPEPEPEPADPGTAPPACGSCAAQPCRARARGAAPAGRP